MRDQAIQFQAKLASLALEQGREHQENLAIDEKIEGLQVTLGEIRQVNNHWMLSHTSVC